MNGANGQGETRLDRIEAIIERAILANEAAHDRFKEEDQRLLTAQILMHAAMTRMADVVAETGRELQKLKLAMEETTGKLSALTMLWRGSSTGKMLPGGRG